MRSTGLILVTILTWSFCEATTVNEEVLINATTNISCFPNEDIQIQWQHTAPSGSINYVYAGGRFFNSLSRGFRLEKDSNTGPYYLVIPHARTEDAGLYECKEDSGSRVFGSTQLTVLESNPVCLSNMRPDGYVGPTTCNLKQEDMTFTCAVLFSGIPPQMIWKTLNGSQSFNASTCKLENGRKICSLIIKSDPLYDGTIVNCQLTTSTAECSTEVIKIQYFESQPSVVKKNVDDKYNCTVKSNQKLEFKWAILQGNQYVTVIESQELLIQSRGFYRCEIKYKIRNSSCVADGPEVNALIPNNIDCETDQGIRGTAETTVAAEVAEAAGTACTKWTAEAIATTSVLGTSLVIFGIFAVLIYLRRKKK